jgi:hypothetical protein
MTSWMYDNMIENLKFNIIILENIFLVFKFEKN